ncbi:MAG TPA: serine/threonine-protein kinase, partial [Polyangiaceae bacterium]
LVMEYIEGDTVGHLMARAQNVNRKIPVPIVVRIMLDTLTGLNAAHDLADDDGTPLEIVHRDVSPQNILVGVDGVARITDFGVAKAQARLANATQGGQLKGKLAYMSPEQVRGNSVVDRRADVFAAGIVTWELLTGQRLFKAEGEAETLFKVVAAEVPPLRNFEPSVPPEVEVVVRRALAPQAADRFATTSDFAEALEQAARTYNLVATVRQTAAFVNEMIGLDISQQREIVRAWLGRSDVSKSGIARSLDQRPELAAPAVPPAATSAPILNIPSPAASSGANLAGLDDDDLDLATRVDDPGDEEDATRIQQLPSPNAPTSSPIMSVGGSGPRPQYSSVPTSREFQPMGSMMNQPPTQAAFAPPQMSAPPAASSGAFPPAPVAYPWQQQQQLAPPPQQKRGLPVWTLVIPAIIIIGGAIFLGMRQHRAQPHQVAPPPPATTMTTTTTTTAAPTATDTTPPTIATATTPTTDVTATPPATGMTTATATAPAPVHVTAPQVATARPQIDTTFGAPHTTTVRPRPAPTHHSNAATVDSKEFGGRD